HDVRLELGGHKQRLVLAILLTEANHVVPVGRLLEALWRGDPPGGAEHTLHVYISQLRKVLQSGAGPSAVVTTQAGGYMLIVAPSDVDAVRFTELAEEGRQLRRQGAPAAARTM